MLVISGICAPMATVVAQKAIDLDQPEPTIFYDQDGEAVSKQKFNRLYRNLRRTHTYGDSAEVRRLVPRIMEGTLDNRGAFLRSLTEGIENPVPEDKPTIIIFYPGFDECNSTGTNDRFEIKQWHKELEEELMTIAGIRPLYLYRDNYGLRKYYNIINWRKDPKGLVEKQFFRYHYPCRSFVVIGVDGTYRSHFGVFSKDQLWEMTKSVVNQRKP
jgi:hypothetical protein